MGCKRLGKGHGRLRKVGQRGARIGGLGRVTATGKGINIGHHASRTVNDGEMAAQKFLRPTADNMSLAIVVENSLHCATITDPIKNSAPEVFLVLGNTPSTASGFSNK